MFINVAPFILVGVLLLCMYLYMYKRMHIASEEMKKNQYQPDMHKSILELVTFIAIYAVCSALALWDNMESKLVSIATVVSFLGSIILFSRSIYLLIGKFMIIVATGVMLGFFIFVGLWN